MRYPKTVMSAVCSLALGMVTALTATTASAADPGSTAPATTSYAAYEGSPQDAAATRAFHEAVMKSVAEKRAANPGALAVTVVYDASGAPSFAGQIASSTQIWNGSVTNVRLQQGSNADFTYEEGNDARGSYASTDGHGRGFIFLDYAQNQQYNSTRVTAHETGHVLGLPDTYSGPCSQLMSGGGPGTSCQNTQPDANERNRVNSLWVNGFLAGLSKTS